MALIIRSLVNSATELADKYFLPFGFNLIQVVFVVALDVFAHEFVREDKATATLHVHLGPKYILPVN